MPGRAPRPVIGVVGNGFMINDTYPVTAAGKMGMEAIARAAGGLPLMIPAQPGVVSVPDLLEACDGFVFPGGRANVHPSHYGEPETEAHGPFDPDRDGITLPLIRAAVETGTPILGICRGFQEIAVAFGSTLHPEIRELPGRMNHRMPPDGTIEEKFAKRHKVALRPGGVFHRLWGAEVIETNTLHGQGVIDAGLRIDIEGRADDGTAEALAVREAPGFALAVQWHAEYLAWEDPESLALFGAFGAAAEARARRRLAA